MRRPLLPRHAPVDDAGSAVGRKDAAHNFDGAAFSRAVRADVADHFPVADGEGNVAERVHARVFAPEQRFDGLAQPGAASGDLVALADVLQFDHRSVPPFYISRYNPARFNASESAGRPTHGFSPDDLSHRRRGLRTTLKTALPSLLTGGGPVADARSAARELPPAKPSYPPQPTADAGARDLHQKQGDKSIGIAE